MSPGNHVNTELPLDRKVAREAAHWLMRLGSSHATAADIRACNQWRADNEEHERAWQRAQTLTNTFGLIPHDVGMAALSRVPNPSRRIALKTLATAIVASPVAWASWNAAPVVRWRADYRTAAGEQREWLLADGSRIWLNTASAIDQEYTDTEHTLWLREGEVYMQASANHQPKLTIQTRLGEIYPHASSRFTLRLDAQQCLVSVMEGQVDVQPAAAGTRSMRLGATQQAAFDAQTVYPARSATSQHPDWLQGTLFTDAMRLDTFAAEISRYRTGIVRCDPRIAAMRISGTFQLNNTDGILRALPALLPIQVNYRTSYWVTLEPSTLSA